MTNKPATETLLQATRDALSAMCGIKSQNEAELANTLEHVWLKGFIYSQASNNPATPNEAKQEASAFKAGAEAMLSHLIRAARPYGFRFVSAHPIQERATAFASFLAELTRVTGLPPDEFQDIALFHAENIPDVRDLRDVGITPAVTSPIDDDLDRLRSKQSQSLI